MDFCSLDDAFPAAGGKGESGPSIGCAGGEATSTALKHEKKRAKKCKGPRLQFVESNLDEAAAGGMAPPPDSDPDRPSMGYRTAAPAPFTAGVGTGPSTSAAMEGYKTHEGFTSCGAKKPSEKFQGGIQPVIDAVQQASGSTAAPGWFTQQVTSDDGFTPYMGSGSDDENANSKEYLLQPSFENSFSALGVDKANGGPVLPLPNLSDRWKPMTPGGATAFYERLPAADSSTAGGSDVAEIKTKLDRIFARLDELDTRRVCTDNSNTEVGMFVMSGIFVMFLMDLLVRKTSTNLRIFSA